MMGPDLDSLEYLLALPRYATSGVAAYRPGFERIGALLEGLGHPERALRIAHVGGTNGKGSTASMIAAIASASGHRAGLHTSPHLLDVTERMRVDGLAAGERWLADAVRTNRRLFDDVQPSFFEATLALSLLYFREKEADIAVVEVGLGGRLDATNILSPNVSVITNVSIEHADILGNTIEAIAHEKAGIIKRGVPVVSAAEHPEARRVIRETARERQCEHRHVDEDATVEGLAEGPRFSLRTKSTDYGPMELDLPGEHQVTNAVTAVLAAERMLPHLTAEAVRMGLASVRSRTGLRARLEVIRRNPPLIVDVAHNPDGLRVALRYASDVSGGTRPDVLLALMKDKDVPAIADVLRFAARRVFVKDLDAERAFAAADLVANLRELGIQATLVSTFDQALEASTGHPLLIAGSHLLAAEALRRMPLATAD